MRVTQLELTNFRNIAAAELTPHPHFNVLTGQNGAGKTNVLESIYVLGNVRTFRDAKNRDLVRLNADSARVDGTLDKFGHRVDARLEISGNRKRFYVNDKGIPSFADYLGTLVVVVFAPGDLYLLRGAASERRRFLDRVVCGAKPAHLADLQDYDRALRSRNQLLKAPRIDAALLAAYSEQLIPLAGRITARRIHTLEALRPRFQQIFADIFAPNLAVDVRYRARASELTETDDADLLAEQLAQRLQQSREDERRAGHTLVGPHRDDMQVTLGDLPAREYASQGQTRALVLALKITEIRFLEVTTGDTPVLLLDDVSSELDARRNAQLFDLVREVRSQTFITTTDRSYIQIEDDLAVFRVEGGEVSGGDGVIRSES